MEDIPDHEDSVSRPNRPDLGWHIQRAMGYIERWAAPLVQVDAVEAIARGHDSFGAEDLAHNVGRAIDGLLKGQAATSRDADPGILDALRSVLFASLQNEVGFPAAHCSIPNHYFDGFAPGMACASHNVREAVQGLLELHLWDGDARALQLLDRLLETLLRITDSSGHYRPERVAEHPLLVSGIGFSDGGMYGDIYKAPTQDRGRIIMALTQVYRALGDGRALELADRFARLMRSEAFTEDGRLTHFAGSHTHSITGTVHGLADWGLLAGDRDTLEHARRIMDVGLAPTCSSFGWSVEGAWREKVVDRGEVNNTADMVQTALILGCSGWPGFFETAERMIRSHLLPTQWLAGQEYHQPRDDPRKPPAELLPDEGGGWGCPAVNDRYGGSRLGILDITQGGIQGLWAALREGLGSDAHCDRINLLFSNARATEDASGPLEVTSLLPEEGRLLIKTGRDRDVWVRRPSWLDVCQTKVRVDGTSTAPRVIGDWIIISSSSAQAGAELTFTIPLREDTEWINHRPYDVVYAGDHIVAMDPKGGCAPMYPSLAELAAAG